MDLVNPAMQSLGVAGGVDEVVAAGARHISFRPLLGPDPEKAIIALGTKVVPAFKAVP
jgi:hypothetical protein